jgi:16S rRNA (cytosine967-C5)-methyltransferase
LSRRSAPVPATARSVALEVVRRVADEGAFSNRLLPAFLERSSLDRRDRDLAVELAYGTLRRLLRLDFALRSLVDRPLERASGPSRAALRLGAYQVLFTRIPPHAAVGETVDLVGGGERRFVNAVLRRLASTEVRWPEGEGDDDISVRTGLAAWAVRELRLLLPAGEVEAAAAALAEPAPLTLRPNPCRAPEGEPDGSLRRAGLDPRRGAVHRGSLRLEGGAPATLPGFAEGWFAVQDEASTWVVDVLNPRPGERVLDACGAPGGKAADIACRAGEVVAADLSEARLRLVAETARRLGVRVMLVVQDAARPALDQGFDRVLVDAPCTGIGSARRRPELLWRPQRRHLSGLARLQVRLAAGAASLLKPGGTFVYSVCTFPRAETEAAARALDTGVPGLRPDPFPDPEGGEAPAARLWPHRHGTDAMFVARYVAGG